jgi:hypothetical protein
MDAANFRRMFAVAAVGLMGLGLAGCPSKSTAHNDAATQTGPAGKSDAKEAKWLGTYEQQSPDKMVLVLQPDHKGSMAPAGEKGEITWEVAGDDKITIHMGMAMTMLRTSDGNLRDDEGVVWKKTK